MVAEHVCSQNCWSSSLFRDGLVLLPFVFGQPAYIASRLAAPAFSNTKLALKLHCCIQPLGVRTFADTAAPLAMIGMLSSLNPGLQTLYLH